MRLSKTFNCLFITSIENQDIYDDVLNRNTLKYTGMEKNGDQKLKGNQNTTLYESKTNRVTVLFFKHLSRGGFKYEGIATLNKKPYIEKQSGENKILRDAWIFPLKIVSEDYFINLEVLDSKIFLKRKKRSQKVNQMGMKLLLEEKQ